jgi:hypothetical protein
MPLWTPDPTFYPSPKMAMEAPPEKLAFVAMLNVGDANHKDALGVVDTDPGSSTYARMVGQVEMPDGDNELHHFGWNACSSCLCPYAPHAHMERRYLIVPDISSSRIHIIDTKPDPRKPKIVRVIEPEEFTARTGYTAPHTIHCGPDGIYGSALGSADGGGPGASSSWTARASMSWENGRSIEVRRTWPTTSGGTWATTRWSPASGALPTWSSMASIRTSYSRAAMVTLCTSGTSASGAICKRWILDPSSKWCSN